MSDVISECLSDRFIRDPPTELAFEYSVGFDVGSMWNWAFGGGLRFDVRVIESIVYFLMFVIVESGVKISLIIWLQCSGFLFNL